jgi:hypothetical protein
MSCAVLLYTALDKGIFKMINFQDSELLQLIHEQQLSVGIKQLNQYFIFNLSATSCFFLSVSLSVIALVIFGG